MFAREHVTENAHGERLLSLLEDLFAEVGWSRSSLDRIGVGLGPGSFTGLRVGIAFAQGVALGLGRPILGICSLRTMAAAVPASVPALRAPFLDARRGEWFAALYDSSGRERLAPCVIRKPERPVDLEQSLPGNWVALGEVASTVAGDRFFASPATDLPHATYTALCAASEDESKAGAEPLYLRPVDAIVPNLPPSPLSSPLPSHDDRDR